MSKYVIELRPDCKVVQQICESNGQVCIGARSIQYLEELNSDYINEHYGNLQDDAYKRGFEKGKDVRIKGCEGCMYQDTTIEHNPCNLCCNAFLNRWTAKDNKFKFGDEIIDSNGVKGCVVSKDNEGSNTMYALFDKYSVPQCVIKSNYRKTGKHYDIDKILEEMKK